MLLNRKPVSMRELVRTRNNNAEKKLAHAISPERVIPNIAANSNLSERRFQAMEIERAGPATPQRGQSEVPANQ